MNQNSTILFVRPSFLEGMARTLDLGGTLNEYNAAQSGEQADCNAIMADWRTAGDAIEKAMYEFAQEHNVRLEDINDK